MFLKQAPRVNGDGTDGNTMAIDHPSHLATGMPGRRVGETHHNRAAIFAGIAVAVLLLANCVRTDADPDLWGHLLFGLTSLEEGRLADTDPYSYTAQGCTWTNHEWLTELAFGAAYSALGTTGLILLRAALLTVAVAAVAVIAVRRRLPPIAMVGLALFGITVMAQLYRVRPQMFTYAFMALMLLLCDGHRAGRRLGLCLVPVMIAFWTNLHAGFVAGLGIFGIHWLGFVAEAWQRPDRWRELTFLGSVMFASLAATLLNPYGLDYWRYVLFAVTLPRPAITEWGSVFVQNGTVLCCYATAVLVPGYVLVRSRRTGHWAETAAFLLGAVLAAQHARHMAFLLLFGAVVFARRLPEFIELHGERLFGRSPQWKPLASAAFALLILATTVGGVTKLVREVRGLPSEGALVVSPDCYPVQAVDFLIRNQIRGNLDCGFTWGEYCIFKLFPHCRVFCDGRYETVYPPEVSHLVLGDDENPHAWRQRINDFPTDLILAPPDAPFADWAIRHGKFVEIYADSTARLLVRRASRNAELLRAWKEGRLQPPKPARRGQPFPA